MMLYLHTAELEKLILCLLFTQINVALGQALWPRIFMPIQMSHTKDLQPCLQRLLKDEKRYTSKKYCWRELTTASGVFADDSASLSKQPHGNFVEAGLP